MAQNTQPGLPANQQPASSGAIVTPPADGSQPGQALNQVLAAGGYPTVNNTNSIASNTTQGNTITTGSNNNTKIINAGMPGDMTGIYIVAGMGVALLIVFIISAFK